MARRHLLWEERTRSARLARRTIARLALNGPMAAVGWKPDPAPWHGLSYAPLSEIAAAYVAAGAELSNFPGLDTASKASGEDRAMSGRPLLQLYTTMQEFEDLHTSQRGCHVRPAPRHAGAPRHRQDEVHRSRLPPPPAGEGRAAACPEGDPWRPRPRERKHRFRCGSATTI
jgi:hypothetical protein